MARPLARWTIGGVIDQGFETLTHAVRRFGTLYPEFDRIVCFNNLKDGQRERLDRLGVRLHAQRAEEFPHPLVSADAPPGWKFSMPGWGWKLVPLRLRPGGHELWIDNDIIVRERLPSIDRWLGSSAAIVSSGLQRAYGCYEDAIPPDAVYCVGFFGLPPGHDFEAAVRRHLPRIGGPLGYYDEQGLTVSCLMELDRIVVPQEELAIVKRLTRPFAKGLHFIGVNRTHDHEAWGEYKCYTTIP